ncbi:hypothetical protein [Streptomyces sp. NPDC001404]|uniref:hypothetical protein n=1 Tax=Streptomyces sp. NPDC001404 TaxID=3364571 RepID=UPI00369C1B0F
MAVDDEDRLRMLLAGQDYAGVADLLNELAAMRRQETVLHPRRCPCRYCHSHRQREAAKATRQKWARRRAGSAA